MKLYQSILFTGVVLLILSAIPVYCAIQYDKNANDMEQQDKDETDISYAKGTSNGFWGGFWIFFIIGLILVIPSSIIHGIRYVAKKTIEEEKEKMENKKKKSKKIEGKEMKDKDDNE